MRPMFTFVDEWIQNLYYKLGPNWAVQLNDDFVHIYDRDGNVSFEIRLNNMWFKLNLNVLNQKFWFSESKTCYRGYVPETDFRYPTEALQKYSSSPTSVFFGFDQPKNNQHDATVQFEKIALR